MSCSLRICHPHASQRRYNKDPTTKPGTLTTYTRCLAQLLLPFVLFLMQATTIISHLAVHVHGPESVNFVEKLLQISLF